MKISIISEFGTDLSDRSGASRLRHAVLEATNTLDFIELDFQGVRTLSESFADELFAVLVVQQGEDWFRHHVKVLNLSAPVRHSILKSVQDRLTSHR